LHGCVYPPPPPPLLPGRGKGGLRALPPETGAQTVLPRSASRVAPEGPAGDLAAAPPMRPPEFAHALTRIAHLRCAEASLWDVGGGGGWTGAGFFWVGPHPRGRVTPDPPPPGWVPAGRGRAGGGGGV